MSRKVIKKTIAGTLLTLLLLTTILVIHIYVVTRPKVDAKTVAMARIDIKQNIDESKAGAIENWLSGQSGVDHVVLNRQSDIIVLTFYPIKVSASQLTANLCSTFNIKAERFMPSAEQMKSGCPAMGGSFMGKLSLIFTHFFNHN